MKRTFLAKRNALLSSRSLSWGAFALIFSILALLVRLLAPNLFWQASAPLFRVADAFSTGTHVFLSGFSDTAQLAQTDEKLVNENITLAAENQTLTQKFLEVSALLGTVPPKSGSGILAAVLARPPESPYDTLVLAAGEKEGVTAGMEAFGQGGVPLGVVSAVLVDFSRVTLFSAPGMVTSGWVGHGAVPISLLGTGGGSMSASVARAAGIVPGDTVFAPGPGMLPVGSISRVDGDSLSPAVTLRIVPAVNPFEVAWVELRATGPIPASLATSTLP